MMETALELLHLSQLRPGEEGGIQTAINSVFSQERKNRTVISFLLQRRLLVRYRVANDGSPSDESHSEANTRGLPTSSTWRRSSPGTNATV